MYRNSARAFVRKNLQLLQLSNKHFTVISDDCWGGQVYQELGLAYQSPFIGLFINPEDYLKLCKHITHYLDFPLIFVKSKKRLPGHEIPFPVATLDDIKINFMHYSSQEEALQKWQRRVKRVNISNLFFKVDFSRQGPYGERDYCSEDIEKWNQLGLSNSIAITSHQEEKIFQSLYIPEHSSNAVTNYWLSRKSFSLVNWLANGEIKNTVFNRFLTQ